MDMDDSDTNVVLLSTIEINKSKYTSRYYTQAKLTRKLQVIVGRPEIKYFIRYLDNNNIPNCPISRDDVIAAHDIFGRDVGGLQGKTTWRRIQHIRQQTIGLPMEIKSKYRNITLCVDNMLINKIGFFITISRHIYFITAEHINNRSAKTLSGCLMNVHKAYLQLGFKITNVLGDGEFRYLDGIVTSKLNASLNIAGEDEHVPLW